MRRIMAQDCFQRRINLLINIQMNHFIKLLSTYLDINQFKTKFSSIIYFHIYSIYYFITFIIHFYKDNKFFGKMFSENDSTNAFMGIIKYTLCHDESPPHICSFNSNKIYISKLKRKKIVPSISKRFKKQLFNTELNLPLTKDLILPIKKKTFFDIYTAQLQRRKDMHFIPHNPKTVNNSPSIRRIYSRNHSNQSKYENIPPGTTRNNISNNISNNQKIIKEKLQNPRFLTEVSPNNNFFFPPLTNSSKNLNDIKIISTGTIKILSKNKGRNTNKSQKNVQLEPWTINSQLQQC